MAVPNPETRSLFPVRSRWLDVGGLRIHCRYSEGTGPAIVLLPGGMLDSSMLTWRRALEALPPHFRVFVPDLPGYGHSDKPDASYTTDYFIDFLEGLLDALTLEHAILCGSSMSGAIVLGLALRAPTRVEKLVLSGSYGLQPRVPLHRLAYLAIQVPGLPELVRRVLDLGPSVMRLALRVAVADPGVIDDQLVDDARASLADDRALKAFAAWLRSELQPIAVRTNYADQLDRLTMPVLILHGGRDWMLPARYARHAYTCLPHATLHLFENAGHLVPREYPETVNRILTEFLYTGHQLSGKAPPVDR